MRRSQFLSLVATMIALGATASTRAALTQVGDFRISTTDVSTTFTPFNTFSFSTRSVTGAPLQIKSTFAGVSQNNDATLDSSTSSTTTDLMLQSFSSQTNISTLSRAAAQTKIGAVSWTFDLSGLDSYLSTNQLSLNQVTARLVDSESASTIPYDLYLSYTDPSAGLTQTGLTSDQSANYSNLYQPAQGQTVGSAVGGKFILLASGTTASLDLSQDLTALYKAGTKQFTLIMASDAFGPARSLGILANSGIYIDTSAVPEPTMVGLAGFAVAGLLRRRAR